VSLPNEWFAAFSHPCGGIGPDESQALAQIGENLPSTRRRAFQRFGNYPVVEPADAVRVVNRQLNVQAVGNHQPGEDSFASATENRLDYLIRDGCEFVGRGGSGNRRFGRTPLIMATFSRDRRNPGQSLVESQTEGSADRGAFLNNAEK
jgi:hypothetical protein